MREKARIDEVVSSYVTLRNAGGGSMKGLCPFHDEKSPSFHVTPAREFFHCFGCQEGGDVITFLMKIDGLGFTEAVERLADKYGVQLRYEEGDGRGARPSGPPAGPAGRGAQGGAGVLRRPARHPRRARGPAVPRPARLRPGRRPTRSGSASRPRDGEALLKHLRQKGFKDDELVAGGLVGQGRRPTTASAAG